MNKLLIKTFNGISLVGLPFSLIGLIYFGPSDQTTMTRLLFFLTISAVILSYTLFKNQRLAKFLSNIRQKILDFIELILGINFRESKDVRKIMESSEDLAYSVMPPTVGAGKSNPLINRLVIITLILAILLLIFLLICVTIYLIGLVGSSKKVCLFAVALISIISSSYYVLFTKYKEKEPIEKIGVVVGVGGGTPGIFTFLIDPFIE